MLFVDWEIKILVTEMSKYKDLKMRAGLGCLRNRNETIEFGMQ